MTQLRKPRVGVLTFSDGREYAHEPQIEENLAFQEGLQQALEAKGFEVVAGELVWSNAIARQEATKLALAQVDCTIFNYAVWAFPQFSVMASHFAPGPLILLGQVNPAKPGMVAVLAAAGALEQVGVTPARATSCPVRDLQVVTFLEQNRLRERHGRSTRTSRDLCKQLLAVHACRHRCCPYLSQYYPADADGAVGAGKLYASTRPTRAHLEGTPARAGHERRGELPGRSDRREAEGVPERIVAVAAHGL